MEEVQSYRISKCAENTLSVEEVFGDIFKKYGKSGTLLAGLRHREGLSRRKLAAILNIAQTDLSAMENGKRNIGKELAKRIAGKFKLDYRIIRLSDYQIIGLSDYRIFV